ncbi:3-phosphoshikimate 1-carboxyvinyltransferase [Treponema pedis]|uniref:3-phosphoshikimate 1-carboxyvinyltransferase n=1 Tax=Treponema pedis TaxID=409322 RepID=UPI0003FA20D9|nr:3-phosphoshikimate 1-carboxyvinyltransferase [Treponema pedis]
MFVRVKKSELISCKGGGPAEICIPPSKSHSIRALILASFADDISEIENILISGDVKSTVSVLQKLGVKIKIYKTASKEFLAKVTPPACGIKGFISGLKNKPVELYAGNSGSVFYFLGAALTALPFEFIFTGDASLCNRPASPLAEIYEALGIDYAFSTEAKKAPVKICGKDLNLHQSCRLTGDFSQPVTGLLFSSALREGHLNVNLKRAGELPYLKMTLEWLKICGINFTVSRDFKKIQIKGGQKVKAFKKRITGDWSAAAFPIAAAIASDSELKLKNVDIHDVQGDSGIVGILKKMRAEMEYNEEEKSLIVFPHNGNLSGGEFDISDMPDLLPALSAVACFANGKTVLKNIGICRFKECDRVSAVCSELGKFGADITEGKDFLVIKGLGGKNLHCGNPLSLGDHRIAMMSVAAGLGIAPKNPCAVGADFSEIGGTECISVTYPSFIEDLKVCGAKIEEVH